MENFLIIGSILTIHIFAWFTPGPQIALIIRNSLIYSRKTGFWTAAGFAIGNFIHILISVIGLGLLISQSPSLHTAIKFLGVGYLAYLGVKTFLTKTKRREFTSTQKDDTISPAAALRVGLTTNLLNPKAQLFFASIFGTLLSAKTPFWVIATLMVIMPLNTLVMASLWSVFFTHGRIKNSYAQYQIVINRLLGVILILLALKIALTRN
ncbi:MAG: LysE family transporter [Microgenomates group bacterium]